jgi:hypothetical protein
MTSRRLKVAAAAAIAGMGMALAACSGTALDDASNADAGLHVGAGGASGAAGAGGAQAGVGGVAGTGAGGVEGGTIVAAHCSDAGVCNDEGDAQTDADAGEACVPGQVWKSTSDRIEIWHGDGNGGGYDEYQNDRAGMTPQQIALLDALCVATTLPPPAMDSDTYKITIVDTKGSTVAYNASPDDELDRGMMGTVIGGLSTISWSTWAPFIATYRDSGVGPSVDAGGGEHIWAAGYRRFGVETRYQGFVAFPDGGNVYMSLLFDAASRELTAHGVLGNGTPLDGTARLSDAETSSLLRQLESVTTVDADAKCSFSDGDVRRVSVVDAYGEVHDYPDRAWTCNGYSAGPIRPTVPCIDADLIPTNKLIDLVADCTCPDAGAAAAPSVCVGNAACSAH